MPSTTPGFCSLAGSNVLTCPACRRLNGSGGGCRAANGSGGGTVGADRQGGVGRVSQDLLLLLQLPGHAAAILPAGLAHVLALPRRAFGQVIAEIVAAGAQLETHLLAIGRVLQVLGEIAHPALRFLVDADDLDLVGHPGAAPLVAQHGRHDADRRHAFDVVAGDPADLLHVPVGVAHALQRARFRRPRRR